MYVQELVRGIRSLSFSLIHKRRLFMYVRVINAASTGALLTSLVFQGFYFGF